MKRHHIKWAVLAAGTVAATTCTTNVQGQAVDSLLDKLVDKGILTAREANDLRTEADKDFGKAYAAKSGMPDWVTAFKINGDFRARMEGFSFDNGNFTDRLRYRYRLRLGAVAVIRDDLEVGLRLTSSDTAGGFTNGDPISGNTTLRDNGAKKFVFIDLAYGKYTPLNLKGLTDSIVLGKMENPFLLSDMVFDQDYTPEGIANTFSAALSDDHTLKLNLGAFVLDEIANSAKDPYLLGAQLRWDAKWTGVFSSSVGLSAFSVGNVQSLESAAVPNVQAGNSRNAGGDVIYHFNPIVADAAVTATLPSAPLYNGPFPIRVYGEYMHNPAAPVQNSAFMAGVAFGKTGKKGTYLLDYRYKYLEANSWYEELVDSDYGAVYPTALANSGIAAGYGAGTNVKGHVVRAGYSPFDALTLQGSVWMTQLVKNNAAGETGAVRFQVDANWKF